MKLLNLKEEEVEKFELGTLEAGKQETFTYMIFNDEPAQAVELTISSLNTEIEFINFPDSLTPFEKATFSIVWKPAVDIKEGLKAPFQILGKLLYKPKQ